MAAKPLTTEAIALTEKKMDMSLDDIIKMSKSNTSEAKKQRVSNRSQKFLNSAAPAQEKSTNVRRFMESRSSLRQGVLAQRRSNFQGNQFPIANQAARKAAVASIRNRAFNRGRGFNLNKPRVGAPPVQRKYTNGRFTVKQRPQRMNAVPRERPQTLDSLFANMKEQRMRALSHQNNGGRGNGGGQLFANMKEQRMRALSHQNNGVRGNGGGQLFANMKEQRMRALSHQNNGGRGNGGGQQRRQWGRGQFGN